MTDMPREIIEEARKIAGDIEGGIINYNDALWVKRKAPRIIARAILSRDKRAAEIAEGRDRNVMWTPAEIAAAILTYDTPHRAGGQDVSADIPREIDQIATRIASNYLHMNISCQRLHDEVVEALLSRDKRAAENEEVLRNLEQAILQCRTLADFLTVQKTVQVMQASGAYDTPTGQEDVAARSEAEAIENLRVDMYGDKGRPDIYDGLLPRATRTTGQEDAP